MKAILLLCISFRYVNARFAARGSNRNDRAFVATGYLFALLASV